MALDKLAFGDPIAGFTGRGFKGARPAAPVTPVTGPQNFSALIYRCRLNVDWDGAPKAYGLNRADERKGVAGATREQLFPLQKNLAPFENPGDNGSLEDARADGDRHWVGVFSRTVQEAQALLRDHHPYYSRLKPDEQTYLFSQFLDTRLVSPAGSLKDVNGRFPVVQMAEMGGVATGYYVSQCQSFTGATNDDWDQHKYVDASAVPYAALPGLPRAALGDFGLVIRPATGRAIPFFFGDTGAGNHVGECSGAVKLALAPERNGEDNDFTFVVFPRSGNGQANGLDQRAAAAGVTAQLTKIRNTGDALANVIAQQNAERANVRLALRNFGGPDGGGNP